MKYFWTILLLVALQLSNTDFALAQHKQGWLKKNWHNMNARFNGTYHSRVLIDEAIIALNKSNKDNFNDVISVYGFGGPDLASQVQGDMETVYKKCSKVILKHGKSKWVDDAYFLIGKAYFFKNDPFAAIETFQHVSNQFPNGSNRFDSKVWIILSFLRQDKVNDAEALLGLLVQEKELPVRLNKEVAMLGAEIYLRQKKYEQAKEQVQKALLLKPSRDEKYRLHFVLGQLLLMQKEYKDAESNFIKTIKMNPPYELAFQSNLHLIKAIKFSKNGSLKIPKKYLNKMLKDDKNIDYYDQIYFELGNLALQENNKAAAIEYYKKSASSSKLNKEQKANSFLALANIYFEDRTYKEAQKYYDSTVLVMEVTHPDYKIIKSTQSVLTDLIEGLVLIETQDSLLDLGAKSRTEIDRIIDAKIAEDTRRRELEAKRKSEERRPDQAEFNAQPKRGNTMNASGSWYFYNPSIVARGAKTFQRKWGARPLVDNWRLASKYNLQVGNKSNENEDEVDDNDDIAANYNRANDTEKQDILKSVAKDKRKYYENIPFSKNSKIAAKSKIAGALFAVGAIYQKDLKECSKALPYYNRLLTEFSGNSNEAETYFNLHKCYKEDGDKANAKKYKNLLDTKYSKSTFSAVLNNRPTSGGLSEDKIIMDLYAQAYEAFKKEDYDKCLQLRRTANEKSPGNSLQAKFDFLAASIVGKKEGKEVYLDALKQVKSNYPGTDIAQRCQEIIDYFISKNALLAEKSITGEGDYVVNNSAPHFFAVVYSETNSSTLESAFSTYNKNNHSLKSLSSSVYPIGDKMILAVQSFNSKDQAYNYYVEFLRNAKFFKDLGMDGYETFVITKTNFKTLLKDKNTNSYSMFFVKHYIQ